MSTGVRVTVESAIAWKYGVERQDGPTALILSRQNRRSRSVPQSSWRTWRPPELIFIATGSEVELAVAAWDKLTAEGVKARVVSMPSTDAFDKQDAASRIRTAERRDRARCRGSGYR